MLFQLGVTDDIAKIGFYSGLVVGLLCSRLHSLIPAPQESTFAVSQTLTSYPWAKASGNTFLYLVDIWGT
jgi:hypothetical protein